MKKVKITFENLDVLGYRMVKAEMIEGSARVEESIYTELAKSENGALLAFDNGCNSWVQLWPSFDGVEILDSSKKYTFAVWCNSFSGYISSVDFYESKEKAEKAAYYEWNNLIKKEQKEREMHVCLLVVDINEDGKMEWNDDGSGPLEIYKTYTYESQV